MKNATKSLRHQDSQSSVTQQIKICVTLCLRVFVSSWQNNAFLVPSKNNHAKQKVTGKVTCKTGLNNKKTLVFCQL
jgi:hypothetical protein